MPNRLHAIAALLTAALLGCAEGSPAPLAPAEAGARVREILSERDALVRAAALGALLSELPPEALGEVQRAFGDASVDRGDTEVVLLATWWARFDPEGARAWTLSDWTAKHLSVSTAIFRTWAERDPHAAWAEAQGLRNELEREISSDAVIAGWHDSGAPGLIAHIAGLESHDQQKAGDTLASRKVVALGAAGALAWVEGLADRNFQRFMAQRVAGEAAWREPEIASRWAGARIDDGPRTSGLARRVAMRWVRSDPEAAMAWLAGLPEGGDRRDGVLEAFRDWLAADRKAAVAWMERQEELQRWLEPALGLYARSVLGRKDPVAALELARQISDEDRRHTTIVYIARDWGSRDEAAARRWLDESDLPEDVVRRARSTGNRARWERHRELIAEVRAREAAEREREARGEDEPAAD